MKKIVAESLENFNKELKLDKEKLEWITDKTNRSLGQTQFLYKLVEGDFEKLKKLEMQIKNCYIFYCPSTKKEVEKILKMKPKQTGLHWKVC